MPFDPFTEPRWYAIQTRSQYEKRVRDQLIAKTITAFLPLWRKRSQWSDRVKVIELPLFPGYLFGHFTFQQKYEVMAAVGACRLVSFDGAPVPIPEEQIAAVQALVAQHLRYDPHPFLEEGMRVRVTHGPLTGAEGILITKKSAARLIIQIDLIHRAVAVDIDSSAVVPLGWQGVEASLQGASSTP